MSKRDEEYLKQYNMDKISWPDWKDEDGNVVTQPSDWSGEWYIDPDEPKESCHIKMTYKEDKIYMFQFTDIVERMEDNSMRTYIDEVTDNTQTDEEWDELKTFFEHYIRTVDSHGGGATWEVGDDVNEDGPQDYHLPYNGPMPEEDE